MSVLEYLRVSPTSTPVHLFLPFVHKPDVADFNTIYVHVGLCVEPTHCTTASFETHNKLIISNLTGPYPRILYRSTAYYSR